jgi:hypothetical protein
MLQEYDGNWLYTIPLRTLTLFPVFMLWGAWGRHAWANRAILYLPFPLDLYPSAQFVMWGWVG